MGVNKRFKTYVKGNKAVIDMITALPARAYYKEMKHHLILPDKYMRGYAWKKDSLSPLTRDVLDRIYGKCYRLFMASEFEKNIINS